MLSELARGAQKTFENAIKLFQEACLLRKKGALSRALFLHQISLEECAKVELIGTLSVSLLINEEFDAVKLLKKWSDHRVKNYTNAYMLRQTEDEAKALEQGDLATSLQAFEKLQADFHQESNYAKNASLYVDFRGGKFVTPNDSITEKMVSAIAKRNKEFLNLMHPKVKMLLEWGSSTNDVLDTLLLIKDRLGKLSTETPNNLRKAFSTLIEDVLKKDK